MVATVTGQDASALSPDDDLVEKLGLDSLTGLRVLAMVEKRFKMRIPDAELATMRTMRRLGDAIQQGTEVT